MQSRHQLIRADAGTGKTYALSLRYLELLAAGVEPSRIVAATFTVTLVRRARCTIKRFGEIGNLFLLDDLGFAWFARSSMPVAID